MNLRLGVKFLKYVPYCTQLRLKTSLSVPRNEKLGGLPPTLSRGLTLKASEFCRCHKNGGLVMPSNATKSLLFTGDGKLLCKYTNVYLECMNVYLVRPALCIRQSVNSSVKTCEMLQHLACILSHE